MRTLATGTTSIFLLIVCLLSFGHAALSPEYFHLDWFPNFGLNIDLNFDGLSRLFVVLISLMGCLIMLYSHFYLKKSACYKRYVLFFALFSIAMLFTVLANNTLFLFICWEATSITSYLLISFNFKKIRAQRAALQGLLVTMTGGLFLLLLAFGLHHVSHTWLLTDMIAKHNMILSSSWYPYLLICFLLAIATKSAQWPFHFWLPNAMEAPTPVSAYLHAATMVKLGLYLTARCLPILGGTELFRLSITAIASMTLLASLLLMLTQTDLKRLLAYSTIMALSMVLLLLANDSNIALQAALAFMCTHALYKAALFLSAGIIDHGTKTRDIRELGGLIKNFPITFCIILIASCSLAGLPPVLGFVSKELIYEAKMLGSFTWLTLPIAMIANIGFVIVALLFIFKLFFGQRQPHNTHAEDKRLTLVPIIFAILSLFFGFSPNLLNQNLLRNAVLSLNANATIRTLALWHGANSIFILSLITFVLGIVAYYFYQKYADRLFEIKLPFTLESIYHAKLNIINSASGWLTHLLQSGKLREYAAIIFLFTAAILWGVFLAYNDVPIAHYWDNAPWFGDLLLAALILSAVSTVISAPYMTSLVMLGIAGLSATLIFVMYSAPDVALTQLLVDIMTVVIIVLALYRLPRLPKLQTISRFYMVRNAILSIAVGLITTLMMLTSISIPLNNKLNEFYTANSLILAHGKNVVNVILVDFRAFDTLGESLVVAMAGIGIYGLWRQFMRKRQAP